MPHTGRTTHIRTSEHQKPYDRPKKVTVRFSLHQLSSSSGVKAIFSEGFSETLGIGVLFSDAPPPNAVHRQMAVRINHAPAVVLKYAGTVAPTAPMAPILLVVGGAKVELAQALVPCETSAM